MVIKIIFEVELNLQSLRFCHLRKILGGRALPQSPRVKVNTYVTLTLKNEIPNL